MPLRKFAILSKLPLSYWVPGAILCFLVAVAIGFYLEQVKLADAQIERDTIAAMTMEATSMQRSIEYFLSINRLEQVQQELNEKSTDLEVEMQAVVNEKGVIIAAGKRYRIGQKLIQRCQEIEELHKGLNFAQIEKNVRDRGLGSITLDSARTYAVALYPVTLGVTQGQLQPKRTGAYVIGRNLLARKLAARRLVTEQIAGFAVPLAGMAGLFSVLFYFVISRRVGALIKTARQFALGDLNARAGLHGKDELAEIGAAFDDMASRVASVQKDLQKMSFSVEHASDSIFWVSRDGRILYANAAACADRGYTREEMLAMNIFDLNPDFQQPGVFKSFFEDLKRRGSIRRQSRHRMKDGRIFPVEVSSNYVYIGGEEFNFATVHDLSERQQHERHVLRTQRMESIGTLAGGIAHDLNNALAPIMMSLGMLRLQYPAESKMLEIVEARTKRCADMVRQLLNFVRGAEGERATLQPARLIQEMENLMTGSFPKNIEILVKCDPKLPNVLGDATQLHQVLMNLCVNARDAMPNGGTLMLAAQPVSLDAAQAQSIPEAKPGNYLLLRVSDTGTGMPPEILDRIFEPFYTTKAQGKGTGLGLSTVMGIVKGHDGFLKVYSQPGQGSTLNVYLPVDRATNDTEHLAKPAVKLRGQGETILLVDDEPGVREVARALLQRMNFKVLTASDGAEALKQAAEHHAELRGIITDLHMPQMDGLAFIRALRRQLPNIPVVVSSGRMDDFTTGEFNKLGRVNFLDKPFTEEQLAAALAKMLI
jgi:PAS domain S-box-containing protein